MFPIAFHPVFKYSVPEGHRFPMDKYELLPLPLLREGIADESDFFMPLPIELSSAHDRLYVDRLITGMLSRQEIRRIGFEQTPCSWNGNCALHAGPWTVLSKHSKRALHSILPVVRIMLFPRWDKLGRPSCTIDGCRQSDGIVLQAARKHDIPVPCSMGGGYSPQLKTIIEAHANTYRVARQLYF